jgi:zinc transporter 9
MWTDFERKVKNTNISVLKRELFNDSMQIPLKYTAYLLSGHGSSGTFFAELIRSSIDAFNHFLLILTNYIDLKPTSKYPYGLENIKYIVVLIPAFLFLSFGASTIYSAFHEIIF